jgi:hypothetical protein
VLNIGRLEDNHDGTFERQSLHHHRAHYDPNFSSQDRSRSPSSPSGRRRHALLSLIPQPAKLYSESGMAKLVRRLRDEARLPATFTLDACRHGGMTELEEAELTDGQGRALSAHKSRAYEGYAKRTMDRALAATRKRHAHRIAASSNAQRTEFRNDPSIEFRNDEREPNVTDSKPR